MRRSTTRATATRRTRRRPASRCRASTRRPGPARTRGMAMLNPAAGETTTILPERKVSSYRVSRDSRLITFMEGLTEKTDYDTIGGTLNALRAIDVSGPTGPAAVRTIAEAKD